jgi:DinB superfamily
VKYEDMAPEDMLPPAEKLPEIASLEATRKLFAEDKALALKMIDQAGEDALANRQVAAPWAPAQRAVLGRYLLKMIEHLERHKSQLFYYLKLQGKPVNTEDLWGEM